MVIYRVFWSVEERRFRSFDAAERWARQKVRQLDSRGFAERATILRNFQEVAVVRLDGADRVWTDLVPIGWLAGVAEL